MSELDQNQGMARRIYPDKGRDPCPPLLMIKIHHQNIHRQVYKHLLAFYNHMCPDDKPGQTEQSYDYELQQRSQTLSEGQKDIRKANESLQKWNKKHNLPLELGIVPDDVFHFLWKEMNYARHKPSTMRPVNDSFESMQKLHQLPYGWMQTPPVDTGPYPDMMQVHEEYKRHWGQTGTAVSAPGSLPLEATCRTQTYSNATPGFPMNSAQTAQNLNALAAPGNYRFGPVTSPGLSQTLSGFAASISAATAPTTDQAQSISALITLLKSIDLQEALQLLQTHLQLLTSEDSNPVRSRQ